MSRSQGSAVRAKDGSVLGSPRHSPPECENVLVAVRVRKFIDREKLANAELGVAMKEQTCQITTKDGEKKQFSFDHCFWSHSDDHPEAGYVGQEGVYCTLGTSVVDNTMKGFNSTIFAYGQTGSGKTYCMFGPEGATGTTEEGLVPRVAHDLFTQLNQSCADGSNITYKVEVCMTEIYLETVYDLLDVRKKLAIRGSVEGGFYLPNVRKQEVRTYKEIETVMQLGQAERTRASTEMNELSSRAHTIFEIEVKQINQANKTTTSKVSLVDLAGSERLKLSKVEGLGITESSHINKALLILGNCIEKIVEKSKHPHSRVTVPFRDSPLTKLLKEGLGGNSKTILLVTISPCVEDMPQTISALRFANRAKQIKTHAVINEDAIKEAKTVKKLLEQKYQERLRLLDEELKIESKHAELREKEVELEANVMKLEKERDNLHKEKEKSRWATELEKRRLEERDEHVQKKLEELLKMRDDTMKRRTELDAEAARVLNEREDSRKQKQKEEEERLELINKVQQLEHLQYSYEVLKKQCFEREQELDRVKDDSVNKERALKAQLQGVHEELESERRLKNFQSMKHKSQLEAQEKSITELQTSNTTLQNEFKELTAKLGQVEKERDVILQKQQTQEESWKVAFNGLKSKYDQMQQWSKNLSSEKEETERKLLHQVESLQTALKGNESQQYDTFIQCKELADIAFTQMHADYLDTMQHTRTQWMQQISTVQRQFEALAHHKDGELMCVQKEKQDLQERYAQMDHHAHQISLIANSIGHVGVRSSVQDVVISSPNQQTTKQQMYTPSKQQQESSRLHSPLQYKVVRQQTSSLPSQPLH